MKKGGKVYLAARSQSKADEAIEQLATDIGKKPIFLELDLGSLSSVKRAAQTFTDLEPRLDGLINNAYGGHVKCSVALIYV